VARRAVHRLAAGYRCPPPRASLAAHHRQQEVPFEDFDFAGSDSQIEQRAMLFQLVEELPPDQRQVIISRFVYQRSLKEIAQELQRSEGAIKQLQLRALQNLRMQMNRKKD
jgi:RNA polymerase sigma factor (sigma-70 family)